MPTDRAQVPGPVAAVRAPRRRPIQTAREPAPCYAGDMTANGAEQVVNDFIAAIGAKDEAAAMACVAEDCYYDNVPIGDMSGKAKMAEFLAPVFGNAGQVEFEVVRQTASGNVVMNERVDKFLANGNQIALPVTGVFEVNDGLITFWRDYFDNGTFLKQLRGE
jgi:limonene-1,2-epoxide hydrolase